MGEKNRIPASCRCGQVTFVAIGKPIAGVACYCRSCREGGRRFEALPGATAVVDPDGGTGYVLLRKDRIGEIKGAERLQEHRLTPESPMRRMVATCCNTPMFADFTKAHWLSVYCDRLPVGTAPLEMRVMTRDRPAGVVLPADVPSYAGHSVRFLWCLLKAWTAMGFRLPKIGV